MSIIINKNKKKIIIFSELLKSKNVSEIILNDSFLENKLISSFYLIQFLLKDKNILSIKIKEKFIEIDYKSNEIEKFKVYEKIFLKNEFLKVQLNKKIDKQITFIFFNSFEKFVDYKIEILNKKFDIEFLNEIFLQNISSYKIDGKLINRIQFKISDSKKLLETDHREINKKLSFFSFNFLNGSALPMWLPNGELVKNLIKNFIREIEEKNNFLFVTTPVLVNKKLYEISGHLKHYKDFMFPEIKDGLNSLMLRPMTCPQHCLIFLNKKRSYKELPLRISENASLFRYESSGSLTGLERVRQMELKDLHVFISKEIKEIKKEINKLYKMTIKVLSAFDIKINKIYLSVHDENNKNKFFSDSKLWLKTEKILFEILSKMNIDFVTMKGEAAFYGPKIDFQIKSILGRDITVSTIQLDFLLPEKFKLKYNTNSQQDKLKIETPIILHHGIFGTYERLISIILEQNNGWLPFWLSVIQVSILIVSNEEENFNYSKKIKEMLNKYKIRTKLFEFKNNLNFNIKESWAKKIPFQIFIGKKEVENKKITIIYYKEPKIKKEMDIFEFIENCKIRLMNKK